MRQFLTIKQLAGVVILLLAMAACKQKIKPVKVNLPARAAVAMCCVKTPARFAGLEVKQVNTTSITNGTVAGKEGMVFIPGGEFGMGAGDDKGDPDEYPKHKVKVNSFWMDAAEVTNAQFAAFVKATDYVTTAEKKPDWNELKKQLPPGTPKPPDSLLIPASLVFSATDRPVNLADYSQWWKWQKGANWRHPQGPQSNLKGKANYPVVQISYFDALAYCKWGGKRLPTEAEWEWAARGGLKDKLYPWGDELPAKGKQKGNFWQGEFPVHNNVADKFYGLAPVRSFPANGYKLYDMAGNVWEWCADKYHFRYYQTINNVKAIINPEGPKTSLDPAEPYAPKRVVRGGSFLCNDSYCAGYRVSRRMKESEDTSSEHLGFRCVVSL